jgi:hypothetical protein
MTNENGTFPAHPVSRDVYSHNSIGLTKREYFAAMAMQGILSSRGTQEALNKDRITWESYAVEKADNLLNELDK